MTIQKNLKRIIIENGSRMKVNSIHGKICVKKTSIVIEDIRMLASSFREIRIEYIGIS